MQFICCGKTNRKTEWLWPQTANMNDNESEDEMSWGRVSEPVYRLLFK